MKLKSNVSMCARIPLIIVLAFLCGDISLFGDIESVHNDANRNVRIKDIRKQLTRTTQYDKYDKKNRCSRLFNQFMQNTNKAGDLISWKENDLKYFEICMRHRRKNTELWAMRIEEMAQKPRWIHQLFNGLSSILPFLASEEDHRRYAEDLRDRIPQFLFLENEIHALFLFLIQKNFRTRSSKRQPFS